MPSCKASQAGRGVEMKHCIGVLVLLATGSLTTNPALAAEASARFTVAVAVPSRVTLTTLEQPALLTLSDEDVRRGYKDVTARYAVSHNDPRGYLLRLSPRVGVTRHVEVRGFAAQVYLRDVDIEVRPQSVARKSDLALEFRFVLEADAQPGTYALPVHVTATPL